MYRIARRIGVLLFVLGLSTFGTWGTVHADTSDSTTYGSGGYGNCDYGQCTLTLSSSTTTNVDIVPSAGGKCSVQGNTVSVLTDNTTGYNLTMTTSGTNTSLTGPGSITALSGTAASPISLANNKWGWRVDGLSGFGAGPTNTLSSGSIPAVTFAGVPASNGTPATLASTSGPANPAATTTVWFGACADATIPSGAYTATVTFTAVTN